MNRDLQLSRRERFQVKLYSSMLVLFSINEFLTFSLIHFVYFSLIFFSVTYVSFPAYKMLSFHSNLEYKYFFLIRALYSQVLESISTQIRAITNETNVTAVHYTFNNLCHYIMGSLVLQLYIGNCRSAVDFNV